MAGQVKKGMRVLVPFGKNKTYVGIVVCLRDNAPERYQVKDIIQVLDTTPVLLPEQLRLWQWIADYYMSPLGDVMKTALPIGLRAEEGYKPKTEKFIRLTTEFCSEQALHIALDMLKRAPKQLSAFSEFLTLSNFLQQTAVTRDELMNASHANVDTVNALVKRGILETYEVEVGRLNHGGEPHPEYINRLSESQQHAYNEILLSFIKKPVTLLHGLRETPTSPCSFRSPAVWRRSCHCP